MNRCATPRSRTTKTRSADGQFHERRRDIVGRYNFRQFGEDCLRLMRAGEPYVVADTDVDRGSRGGHAAYTPRHSRGDLVPSRNGAIRRAMAVHTVRSNMARGRDRTVQRVAVARGVAGTCGVTHELRRRDQFRASPMPSESGVDHDPTLDLLVHEQWYAYTGTVPADMEVWGGERVHDPECCRS